MAQLKKNQMNQIWFTMVDKTDFATIESALTSNFTAVANLVAHGGSAAASLVTISKAVSVFRSGIYRLTIKAAECNRDYMALKITHASAADQLMIFQLVDNDDSDIMSNINIGNSRVLLNQSRVSDVYPMLSDLLSDFQSRVPNRVATDSQLSNLHSDLRSFLVVQSSVDSDVYSALTDARDALVTRRAAVGSTIAGGTSQIELDAG